MRTTVEIGDEQRAQLLELAAIRGEKGFSRLVREAIDNYLREHHDCRGRIAAARAVLGTLDDSAADELRQSVQDLRSRWR